MTWHARLRVVIALWVALSCAASVGADREFRYPEGRCPQAELKYLGGLPVLRVGGTPAEIGRQEAALTRKAAEYLIEYPKDLLAQISGPQRWSQLVKLGQSLLPQFPADHLAELDAFAATAGIDRNTLIGVNTMTDTYRGGFGCSSLIVEPGRSATGGLMFGRNLDFVTLGWLQKFSLIVVCRPIGKHAFVSIGFPGMLGCPSGMNDAGLALATHEVFVSGDGAALFNPRGTPYTLVLRRILEECTTVEEAEQLLRSVPRTTLQNLAVCDRRNACVLEITPKSIGRRDSEAGLLACTNHFRTKPLRVFEFCSRYPKLVQAQKIKLLGLADIAKKLDEVNAGAMTLQTMIFEPALLKLHLAIGSCPSTELPLKTLDLGPLFVASPGGKQRGPDRAAASPVP